MRRGSWKDISLDELRAQGYQAFYIAIGCQGSRKAGILGEDAAGVMSAVDFLHIVSGGNEDYRVDGRSVVIGGGNVAIDVARTAARCGSNEVSMFCLESEKRCRHPKMRWKKSKKRELPFTVAGVRKRF